MLQEFLKSNDLVVNICWALLWAFMSSGLFVLVAALQIISKSSPFIIASLLDQSKLKESAIEIAEKEWKNKIKECE